MRQNYDFKIDNIKDLTPEEISLRKKNLELFYRTGFPNKKDEDWKFSDLNSILSKNFKNIVNNDFLPKEKDFKIIDEFEIARKDRTQILGEDNSKELEKRIFLQTIDMNWTSHIQYLESLRQVIGLRSYGQRDPLIEYKKEAFALFENLLDKLKIDFITILINLTVTKKISNDEKEIKKPSKIDPKYIGKKMSRNEPCFCGSGKKFKKCCGAL